MAHLGLSRVYSGLDNPEAAKRSFEKAKELASGVSDGERRRIEIRGKQLAAMDDFENAALNAAYKKAIDDALAVNMDDPQLWLLRGNAEEANASGRGQRGGAAHCSGRRHGGGAGRFRLERQRGLELAFGAGREIGDQPVSRRRPIG